MSSLHSNAAHQKLSAVKRKLYQDGYRFPMDVESLPLIEKLYADLLQAKELCRKRNSNEVTSTSTSEAEHMDLYRKENIKLIKENSNLHNQLAKLQMATEANLLELKKDISKIERENSELKFLNNQYAHRLKTLETESSQKTERILQLQDKNHPASMHVTGAGDKKKLPLFRKQKMELEQHLPQAEQRFFRSSSNETPDGRSLDLLVMAEETISRLKSESAALKFELEDLKKKVTIGAKQLEIKDMEIGRLINILDGGDTTELVALEAKNRSSQKTIGHLNRQIDQLQSQLSDLKAQAGQRKVAWDDNNNNNSNSREEEEDDDGVESRHQRRLLAKLQKDLEAKKEEANRLNAELASKERELRKNLQMETEHKKEIDDLILRLQEEKGALLTKITTMNKAEKELVLELNKMKQQQQQKPKAFTFSSNPKRNQAKPTSLPTSSPTKKEIEKERDYYKGEVETLARVLSAISSQRSQDQRSASPPSQKSLSRTNSPANKNCSCSVMEHQREVDAESEASRLKRERDELKVAVENYDKHFEEIQSVMKALTHERDHLNALYLQTKEELRERRESERGAFERSYAPSGGPGGGGDYSPLQRLEGEKEEALTRVRNLKHERNELLREIRSMDDVIRAERERYEKTITDLKVALDNSFKEMSNDSSHREARIDGQQQLLIRQLKDEVAQYKATSSQMKLIADQAEEMLRGRESSLASAQSELRSSLLKVEEAERRLEEARRETAAREGEIERLRRSLEKMERERDELQMEVGLKSETQTKIMETQRAKEKQIRELQASVQEADLVIKRMNSGLFEKEREVASLKQRLESLKEELEVARATNEGLEAENRKIQGETEKVTRDVQIVTRDLNDTVRLRNKISTQAQEYLNEIKRCQELLSSKDQEKFDILEQYRLLNKDLERVDAQNLKLEGELSRMRIDLLAKDSEARRLREMHDLNDRSMQDRSAIERNFMVQISSLSASVTSLEEKLQRVEHENRVLTCDLNAARGFVSRLQTENEQLEKQLSTRAFDNEKMESLLEGRRKEIESMKTEIEGHKQHRAELERQLQDWKTKEWQANMALREKQSEAQLLQDRLALNDNKIENQSKELSFHRSKMIEMDAEVEKLKRQIISEKFERERMVQALKAHNVSLPEDSRLGAISPESLSRKINSEKVTLSKSEFIRKYNLNVTPPSSLEKTNGHDCDEAVEDDDGDDDGRGYREWCL